MAIGDALGVTLDDNFGTFTVYDDGALSSAQEAVSLTNKLFWVLVVLVPAGHRSATLAISPRRRRTLLQLSVGVVLSMVAAPPPRVPLPGGAARLRADREQRARRAGDE